MLKKIFFAGIMLFAHSGLTAQSSSNIRNLVFEGAGIRGIAYCGALKEMESRGLTNEIQRVAGTSAGAIMAMAVSLGYSADELSEIIANTNFEEFNEGKYLFAGGINRMSKYFGWYRSRKLDRWLGKIIESKTGNPDITFGELHDGKYKELYITGTCLNKQKLVVFSHETYPQMRIRDAVRISMSIPLYFEAVFLTADGRVIDHPRKKEDLDIMVDGGFTGNFPIRIFDSSRYSFQVQSNVHLSNMHTLGFRIDKEEQIRNDSLGKELAEMQINSIKNYFGAFYTIIIENLNRQSLNDNDWARTISISDGGIKPRIRKLSRGEINILVENGRTAMYSYLQKS
jgi:NTE family protein